MKIFIDSSKVEEIKSLIDRVDGITCNPSIMRKEGVLDYEKGAKAIIEASKGKPVSIEVIADDFDEMERQARLISSWGENVYVKIPIINTKGQDSCRLINILNAEGIPINVTAVTNRQQLFNLWITGNPLIVSIFAGRIADTGENPVSKFFNRINGVEFLWASPREVFNIYQAEEAGANIITVTPELFRKYEKMKRYDLDQLSLDTVKMFYSDAKESGYNL